MNRRGFTLITKYLAGICFFVFLLGFILRFISERKSPAEESGSNRAVWLAEAGVDKGLRSLNTNNWTDWTGTGIRSINIKLGSSGEYSVTVDQANSTITAGGYYPGRTAPKYYIREVRVTLSRGALFGYAIFGSSSVAITGNTRIDSYDSRNGSYGGNNAHKNGDVGSNGDQYGAINFSGNTYVEGSVNTGSQGSVAILGNAGLNGKELHNSDQILAIIPVPDTLISKPLHPAINLGGNKSLTLNAGDYKIPSINLSGDSRLIINGKVRIYLNSTTNALNISAGAKIVVGGSATIYTDGNAVIAAGSIVNKARLPENLIIYGTATAGSIRISGIGDLYAALYAPKSDINIGLNGDIFGSFVGNNVVYTGNGALHYDERLSGIGDIFNYGITSWKEL